MNYKTTNRQLSEIMKVMHEQSENINRDGNKTKSRKNLEMRNTINKTDTLTREFQQ